MADCKKSDIPEKLIKDKGQFKCRRGIWNDTPYYNICGPDTIEYEPTSEDIVAVGLPPSDPNNLAYGAYEALRAAIGQYVYLKNVAFDDEYKSWMSDPITVANAPVAQARLNLRTGAGADCACCGKEGLLSRDYSNDNLILVPTFKPPDKCIVGEVMDDWSFTGTSTNVSWYGCTLQFVVNIYRTYCCVKNENDEIIDYDYYDALISMIIKDGYTYLGTQLLPNYSAGFYFGCVWCGLNPWPSSPVNYPTTPIEINLPPLPGRIYIPVKVKEF